MPMKSSPYMQYAVRCKQSKKFPAIVHIDKTSRVQTVNRKQNSELYDLLKLWYKKTGCPMLLNTSLNIKGQPLLNDYNDINNWQKIHNFDIMMENVDENDHVYNNGDKIKNKISNILNIFNFFRLI